MIAPENVTAILLAAGQSSRFGTSDKLLADLNDKPLILHAAARITELNPARKIAVCSPEVGELLRPLGFEIVPNPNARDGLSTSLAHGIETVDQAAALVCLGDMPFVTLAHLQSLLAEFDDITAPVVASIKNATPLPPAIFARRYFAELKAGQGDRGARGLLATAHHITAPPNELADIDTIEDLRRFRR